MLSSMNGRALRNGTTTDTSGWSWSAEPADEPPGEPGRMVTHESREAAEGQPPVARSHALAESVDQKLAVVVLHRADADLEGGALGVLRRATRR